MACRGSGVRVPPAPPPPLSGVAGQAQVVPRRCEPLRPGDGGVRCVSGEATNDRDREWRGEDGSGRPALVAAPRPADGRSLARLFAQVRTEGRWLIATPGSVSEPSEAFWISELIRANEHLALVAEANGEVVGNILVNVDRGVATEHIGVLSICIA